MRGGEETYVPLRSSLYTNSQRRVAMIRVNSRHSDMTANGGKATGRSSTGGRGFNAAAPESDSAHDSAHAIRPAHHILQVSPKYGECDESPDQPQKAGRSSFLTAAGKQKVNKFSRETSAYAAGALDHESIISGEREHGSRPRHRTHLSRVGRFL
jgi:ribosomal protein S11